MSMTVKSGRGAFLPPTTDQIEERARFDVMQIVKNRPQLHPTVFQMRGEEITWRDIYNHLLARVMN
jgi:hypothetical protein